jgi:PhnB protein
MMTDSQNPTLHPRLLVAGADRAIAFYVAAFGAEEVARYTDQDGRIVHAELRIGGAVLALSEEDLAWQSPAPTSLGGSPVLLTLAVADADQVGARMEAGGARVVFPIQDQFYGKREGRLADPFGHLWIISQHRENLSPAEIQRRVDAWPSSAE